MANIYRPYSREEIAAAARKHNLDPAFLEALYAIESSSGTNPKAMGVQTVKRKRDTTMVRGPFQLEDDTVADYLKRNKMQGADISDPDVYLDVAGGIAADKYRQGGGDYAKAFERYLGTGSDQFGTTTEKYSERGMREMAAIKARDGSGGMPSMAGLTLPPPLSLPRDESASPFMHGASLGGGDVLSSLQNDDDMFGMSPDMVSAESPSSDMMSWKDFLAAAYDMPRPVGLGIPEEMGGDLLTDMQDASPTPDIDGYLAGLVDEQMQGKDFLNATT